MLRKETLEEMRRKKHAYPHEVVAVVDELLALRTKYDRGELVDLSITESTSQFLDENNHESQASWARRLIRALLATPETGFVLLSLGYSDSDGSVTTYKVERHK